MKIITVDAVFIGKDGSEGFEHGRKYRLIIHTPKLFSREVLVYWRDTPPIRYSSIITFLQNWSEVTKVL